MKLPASRFDDLLGQGRSARPVSLTDAPLHTVNSAVTAAPICRLTARLVEPGGDTGPVKRTPFDAHLSDTAATGWTVEFYDRNRPVSGPLADLGEPAAAVDVALIREYVRGMAFDGPMRLHGDSGQEWLLSEASLGALTDWLDTCGAPDGRHGR